MLIEDNKSFPRYFWSLQYNIYSFFNLVEEGHISENVYLLSFRAEQHF